MISSPVSGNNTPSQRDRQANVIRIDVDVHRARSLQRTSCGMEERLDRVRSGCRALSALVFRLLSLPDTYRSSISSGSLSRMPLSPLSDDEPDRASLPTGIASSSSSDSAGGATR
jgi:hypothetical protein